MIFNNVTKEQLKTKADKTDLANYLPTSGGTVKGLKIDRVNSSTNEGGQLDLIAPSTNTSFGADISIDTLNDTVRIFSTNHDGGYKAFNIDFNSLDSARNDIAIHSGNVGEYCATPEDIANIKTSNQVFANSTGWYRIAKITGTDEYYCKLVVTKAWYTAGSETHVIECNSSHTNPVLTTTHNRVSGSQTITKARVTTEGTNKYIEIYYVAPSSVENPIACYVVENSYGCRAIDMVKTSETADGVTVNTTYDIPSNATPITSAGGTLDGNISFSKAFFENTTPSVLATFVDNNSKNGFTFTRTNSLWSQFNSAKVAIQSTAPADTSALWVW